MVSYGTKQPLVMAGKGFAFIGIQMTRTLQKVHPNKVIQSPKLDNNMQYNIGDFVYISEDKYEDSAYGIVISYDSGKKMYKVFWLDGHEPTSEFASSFSLAGGQHE
jgi:hypothetical protein